MDKDSITVSADSVVNPTMVVSKRLDCGIAMLHIEIGALSQWGERQLGVAEIASGGPLQGGFRRLGLSPSAPDVSFSPERESRALRSTPSAPILGGWKRDFGDTPNPGSVPLHRLVLVPRSLFSQMLGAGIQIGTRMEAELRFGLL